MILTSSLTESEVTIKLESLAIDKGLLGDSAGAFFLSIFSFCIRFKDWFPEEFGVGVVADGEDFSDKCSSDWKIILFFGSSALNFNLIKRE